MTGMITRFAPSPTGFLHLGHGYSALVAHRLARQTDGVFLLRVEDIDFTRSRPAFIAAIYEDLAWLGLDWPNPVRVQSDHMPRYQHALDRLINDGFAYPCFCSRKDIQAHAPTAGFDGLIYPGTCRDLSDHKQASQLARVEAGDLPAPAWRLNLRRALAATGPIEWHDLIAGPQYWAGDGWGDVVIARRDIGTSYHLAVVLDDADQGVTHVIRGQDLFYNTHIHRVLQILFNLPSPVYLHHELLKDDTGQRLAKTFLSRPLRDYRQNGVRPTELAAMYPSFPILPGE